jgi:heavy metal sensor kinase
MLRRPTIRFRLALWYAAALLLLLSGVSVTVYAFVRVRLERALTAQLNHDFDTVATVMAAAPHGKGPQGHLPGDVLFIVTEGGRIIYHSNGWCRTKCLRKVEEQSVDDTGVWRSRLGTAYRVQAASLSVGGRSLRATVAEDASVIEDTLGALLRILLLSVPGVIVLCVAGGYFLAGRALSPIGAMASKAREITAESLSERLPVTNPDDELGRVAVVFNETLGRLDESFARLRTFTANVSHELRTPLTAIRSVGEVALRHPLDAEAAREVIGSMLEEVERMTRLVDCMLALARAEPGRPPLVRAELDLASVAESAMEFVRVLAEEKAQTLTIEAEQATIVCGDAITLRQALTNLLDNAIRYTPSRGHICVRVARAPDGRAVAEVEDNGAAIALEERGRIFDRFHRAGGGVASEPRGLGLGLTIARSAVEANGGEIEYEAPPSGGNRFWILLPPCPAGRSPVRVASSSRSPASTSHPTPVRS